ncbi:hypothetical protein CHLRE_02g143107v5 [Chlamydomonas reinhardtii]|uniref:Uncharacterized protein n=1 Tax=Chlamydomonas reinhardtii TaxID=3055 RepID=A0A2K3E4I6_CHLRE|nr:uncharacterized protein CHLRE_02g143107v5 [Chlamydomonas reinhardtii]PNW87700.1 hypothetical protein CHLRE_02g143107v5 [Chlamydomonas reinhardtii]
MAVPFSFTVSVTRETCAFQSSEKVFQRCGQGRQVVSVRGGAAVVPCIVLRAEASVAVAPPTCVEPPHKRFHEQDKQYR